MLAAGTMGEVMEKVGAVEVASSNSKPISRPSQTLLSAVLKASGYERTTLVCRVMLLRETNCMKWGQGNQRVSILVA